MMIDYNALIICGRVIINKKCFGVRISKTAHLARFITRVHCLRTSADDDEEVFFLGNSPAYCFIAIAHNICVLLGNNSYYNRVSKIPRQLELCSEGV